MNPETTEYTRDLRGISMWLLREYLIELGGHIVADHQVRGEGWEASLHQLDDLRLGSLSIGQVRIEIKANPASFNLLKPLLEKKLLRAGG